MEYRPLHFDNGDEPFSKKGLFNDFPIFGRQSRSKRKIIYQLKARRAEDLNIWPDHKSTLVILAFTSHFIADIFSWPNNIFLPKDPCRILFWDPSVDMRDVEAIDTLSEIFSLPDLFWDGLQSMLYEELIEKIQLTVTSKK